jgi:CRISPR-associated protein Csb3
MGSASIPVDLVNPGQVFACLGFLEAADSLCGPAEGGFGWDETPRFDLLAAGAEDPVAYVLEFLTGAKVTAVAPDGSNIAPKFGIKNEAGGGDIFPRREPKLDILPARLTDSDGSYIELAYWADDEACGRDNVKFWGGAAGYSGAARTRDLLNAYQSLHGDHRTEAFADPLNVVAPLSNGLRLDWRRDYTTIDLGFSPDKHAGITMIGYPIVELLAAVGLQDARPMRVSRLHYQYAVWAGRLPPMLARAALCSRVGAFPARFFSMFLGEPNRFDRSILFAQEETQAW